MTEPTPNYASSPFGSAVHQERALPPNNALSQEAQRGMRGKFIESILQLVTQAITGIFLPGPIGTAFDQLHEWFQNILPEQIRYPLQQLVLLLVSIFDHVPVIGTGIGDAIEGLAEFFGIIKHDTVGAQTSADNANVGVARLEGKVASGNVPGGILIDDTFDRAGSSIGADYTLSYFGGGAGSVKIDSGNVYWDASGGSTRGCFVMHNTSLSTAYQAAAVIQNSAFPTITNPTQLRIVLRANTALTHYVEAVFGREYCVISKTVAGVNTVLDSTDGRNSAGDRWTFKAGTDVDVRQFILYCNDDAILTVTDTAGTLSSYGAGFDKPGFVMYAGTQFVPPFFFSQIGPPSLQSFTAYDRLATA